MRTIIGSAVIALAIISLSSRFPRELFAEEKKELSTVAQPLRQTEDGFPMPLGSVYRFGNRQLRHADGVYDSAISPDGNCLATRGRYTVVVWDLKTLAAKLVVRLEGTFFNQLSCGFSFSNDSKCLAISLSARVSRGGRIERATEIGEIWDLETGKKKFSLNGDGNNYLNQTWCAADGKEYGTFSNYGTIRFHSAKDGKELSTVPLQERVYQQVRLAPAVDMISGIGDTGVLKIWNMRTGKELYALSNQEQVVRTAISDDGKMLIHQDDSGKLHVHDVDARKEVSTFNHPADKQSGPMVISKDRTILYFGGAHGQLYRWDLKENKQLPDVGRHSSWTLTSITLSPDEKTLYSMGMDRLVRRWDVATGKEFPLPGGYITRTTLFPDADSKHVIISDHVGCIDYWNLQTGKLDKQLHKGGASGINCLEQSADARWLATGRTTQEIAIWDLKEGKEAKQIRLVEDEKKRNGTDHVQSVIFSPDAKMLYCNSANTGVSAYDPATGARVWNTQAHGGTLAIDTQGKWLVNAGDYKQGPVKFQVLDAKTGATIKSIEVTPLSQEVDQRGYLPWIIAFKFIPNSSTLASAHYDGTIRFTDVLTEKEVRQISTGMQGTNSSIACSPNGKWLGVSSADRKIRIYEMASGKELLVLGDHDADITQVAFTRDSRSILSSADLAPLLWSLKPIDLPKLDQSADAIWQALASPEGAKVFKLQWALCDEPKRAIEVLSEKIKPEDWALDRNHYDKQVANLDSPRFPVREAAQRDLAESQKIPISWLRDSLEASPSGEQQDRLRKILETRQAQPATQEWRIRRAVHILEMIGNDDARALLRKWSKEDDATVLGADAKATLMRMEK